MKQMIVLAAAMMAFGVSAQATSSPAPKTGPCAELAKKFVLQTAIENEKLLAQNAGRPEQNLEVVVTSNKTTDAGDVFFDRYQIQALTVATGKPVSGAPAEVIYTYDWDRGDAVKSRCSIHFFSYVGYALGDYDKLGQQ